jgi:hypothetical protein
MQNPPIRATLRGDRPRSGALPGADSPIHSGQPMPPMRVVEQATQSVNPTGVVLPELSRQSAKMASARLSKSLAEDWLQRARRRHPALPSPAADAGPVAVPTVAHTLPARLASSTRGGPTPFEGPRSDTVRICASG